MGDTHLLLVFGPTPKLITVKFSIECGAHYLVSRTFLFVGGHI